MYLICSLRENKTKEIRSISPLIPCQSIAAVPNTNRQNKNKTTQTNPVDILKPRHLQQTIHWCLRLEQSPRMKTYIQQHRLSQRCFDEQIDVASPITLKQLQNKVEKENPITMK